MQNYKSYLLIFFCTALTLLALHGLVMWKGFAIYGEGSSYFGTDSKLAFRNSGKFAKTARVSMKDFQAQGYMLGSSRLRDGMDPATAEKLTGKTFFNYGVSGLVVKEMKPIVEHLLTYKKPEIIIIGLDFFAFNDSTKPATDMVLSDEIGTKNILKAYLSSFSVKSAHDMIDPEYDGMMCGANGFCHDTRFSPEDVAFYIKAGQKKTGEAGTPLADYTSYNDSMKLFGELLSELKTHDTKVLFYFSPAHILSFHYLKQVGLLDEYLGWKNDVSKMITSHGYDLWDFDIQSLATNVKRAEASPYFNDDIHYTKKFGDIILRTLLTPNTKELESYSIKIDEQALPSLLRYEGEAYPALNPADY